MPFLLKNLLSAGLISSGNKAADERCTLISLTEKGKSLIEEVCPKNKEIIENIM